MFNKLNLDDVCIVGSGQMAIEYSKVLDHLRIKHSILGRGAQSALNFEKLTGKKVILGGLEHILKLAANIPQYLIIAVQADLLQEIALVAIKFDIKKILLEKPGSLNKKGLLSLQKEAQSKKANIFIAYNRRFYKSVDYVKKAITEDEGISNLFFDFSELTYKIDKTKKSQKILDHWIVANSSHVIDLAFHVAGFPLKLDSNVSSLQKWNNKPVVFSGSGKLHNGALFSYSSNWKSAGRWKLEFTTKKRKFLLEPLEEIKEKKIGDMIFKEIQIEETQFKTGLEKMLIKFMQSETLNFCAIPQQLLNFDIINAIENEGRYKFNSLS